MPLDDGVVDVFIGFGDALRQGGLPVGTDDVMTFCLALAEVDPADIVDVYWAGRSSMVWRRDQAAIYDRVFRAYFLDAEVTEPDDPRVRMRTLATMASTLDLPDQQAQEADRGDEQTQLGLAASPVHVQRTKAFSACTPEELTALRRMIAQIRLLPPRRRSRRYESAATGSRLDMRSIARQAIRSHGDVDALRYAHRRRRIRPMVVLLDVSGSMADYSRNLLQFAYSSRRAAGRVEVFCFGTRLTRITRDLDRRRPDDAMQRAAAAVTDWDGGTQIGSCLDEFVRRWARRGISRGAIVVICSDGLDRGDPAVLATAMERLSRLSYRIVWVNPHRGDDPNYRPSTMGMMVANPYINQVLSGHNLRSLEEFADVVAALR
ncbi:MAG: VWA domain-containing protein [Nitriliruptoraceae bacterium]